MKTLLTLVPLRYDFRSLLRSISLHAYGTNVNRVFKVFVKEIEDFFEHRWGSYPQRCVLCSFGVTSSFQPLQGYLKSQPSEEGTVKVNDEVTPKEQRSDSCSSQQESRNRIGLDSVAP